MGEDADQFGTYLEETMTERTLSMQYTFLIVGAHYRPPAKAILSILPVECPLEITPEPENEHDPNAVKVSILTENIPPEQHTELGLISQNYGYSLDDILRENEWHLGYIPREYAATLSPILQDYNGEGKLSFDLTGKPTVKVTLMPKEK